MKKFLLRILAFGIFIAILGEIVIRIFHITPDIPERFLDDDGIQKYVPGQVGYYDNGRVRWEVSEYGWMGVHEIIPDRTITIIGDSYIENRMNPVECNQASYLKELMPEYAFFEAGRPGVTFIEAMEISKNLETQLQPIRQLVYLNTNDFLESITEIKAYLDRVQWTAKNDSVVYAPFRPSSSKRGLYNWKFLYYLYLEHPIMVKEQNRGEVVKPERIIQPEELALIDQLLQFTKAHYSTESMLMVLHPGVDEAIVKLLQSHQVSFILLDSSKDPSWAIGEHDKHWSCYGHQRAAEGVSAARASQRGF